MTIDDRQLPDGDCRLEVSVTHFPPLDWTGLPLSGLVRGVISSDHRKVGTRVPSINFGALTWSWDDTSKAQV